MSNGISGLALLMQERDNILKTELGALLHNLGKLSKAFLAYQRCKACEKLKKTPNPNDYIYEKFKYQAIVGLVAEFVTSPGVSLGPQDWQRLESSAEDWLDEPTNNFLPETLRKFLQQRIICFPEPLNDRSYAIGDFIEFQAYKWYEPKSSGQRIRLIFLCGSKATELLEISHNAASGVEKEDAGGLGGLQSQVPIFRSTVFGHETPIDESQIDFIRESFTDKILQMPSRIEIRQIVKEKFINGVGDTQRTINDISLWDLSASTAAFYKAALANVILDKQWVPRDSWKWRLLQIRFDGLSFLERAPTISDLVGRQSALQSALNNVRKLLEETYPLGNEVYRDENGSAFVMPALNGDDAEGNQLRGLIEGYILDTLRQSELGGELRPQIYITKPHKQAAMLHEALAKPPPPVVSFQDSLNCWWQGEAADICTVCGVRPQGWGAPNNDQKKKAQERNVCYVCLERRGRRAEEWARARHEKKEEDKRKPCRPTACCANVPQGVHHEKEEDKRKPWKRTLWLDEVADENSRLALIVGQFDLAQWLNGEMVQTLLVVCDPANNKYESKNPSFARLQRVWRTTQQFWQTVQDEDIPAIAGQEQKRIVIDVDNADELQKRLGKYHAYEIDINGQRLSVIWDSEDKCLLTASNLTAWGHNGADALLELLKPGTELPLYEPGGYGQRREEQVSAKVARAGIVTVAYSPTIALLTQPASFMVLVPAAVALDAATKITHRYELEMSKVRNRLPLFLGIVFFDRRQPLFSALDAGRRLLECHLPSVECTVTCSCDRSQQNGDKVLPYLEHNHFKRWQEIKLTTIENGEFLQWYASTVMGDGETYDDWYPYVNVTRNAAGKPPIRKQFKHGENQQWVHVSDVNNGDTVCFAPSRFTWLFLDTSARRFEAGKIIKPLEELSRITSLWQRLKKLATDNKLSDSQLHAIITLLVSKKESWPADSAEYSQLAEAILHKEGLDTITKEDLISGRLQAAFELYHYILKQRLKEETA